MKSSRKRLRALKFVAIMGSLTIVGTILFELSRPDGSRGLLFTRTLKGRSQTSANSTSNNSTNVEARDSLLSTVQGLTRDEIDSWIDRFNHAYSLAVGGNQMEGQLQLWGVLQEVARRRSTSLKDEELYVSFKEAISILGQLTQLNQMSPAIDEIREFDRNVANDKYRATARLAHVFRSLDFASLALCFLGKILDTVEDSQASFSVADVFFEAALLADERNYYAANEYGVYLAKRGDLLNARKLFLASNRIEMNQPATLNLKALDARLPTAQAVDQDHDIHDIIHTVRSLPDTIRR
ncbi:MAG TPA: hypothetical protein PKA76_01270 [Pirellulaceae bacterium]|nr:hypothetical protein [Pirellulaceae bacterium]HMP67952.1 hypothetical protein [Pirellulaceae bacterium]